MISEGRKNKMGKVRGRGKESFREILTIQYEF